MPSNHITNIGSSSVTYVGPSIASSITIPTTGFITTGFNSMPTTVNADTVFAQDVFVQGMSLQNFMTELSERLLLLRPNPALEAEWAELKDARDRYVQLEKEFIEKQRIWDLLKS